MQQADSGRAYSLANAVSLVAALSLLGPVLGLLMEISLAWRFGASATVDAFRTAYLLIGFGNQIFIGFLLPHLVVPMLAEYRARGQEQTGWRIAMTFGQSIAVAGLLFVLWVWLRPATLALWLAPGLHGQAFTETLVMLRYFALALVAVLWCGILSGILNMHRVFGVTTLPQPVSNLAISLAVVAFGARSGAIPIGVVSGFGVALALHVRALIQVSKQAGIRLVETLRPGCWDAVFRLTRKGIPLLIMVAASIAGNIIQNQAISRLPPGSLGRFGYASKLMGMFSVAALAIATVMFPSLSEAHASKQKGSAAAMATRGIQMILFLTGPAATVLFILREPLVRVLLGHGAMDEANLHEIAGLWAVLLFQAFPGCLTYFLFKFSFSVGDTVAPATFSCLATLLLFAAIPRAVQTFGGRGIFVATDIAAWFVLIGMLGYQYVRFRIVEMTSLLQFCGKLFIVCVAVVPPALLTQFIFGSGANSFFHNTLELTVAALLCAVTVFIAARLIRLKEVEDIQRFVISFWRGDKPGNWLTKPYSWTDTLPPHARKVVYRTYKYFKNLIVRLEPSYAGSLRLMRILARVPLYARPPGRVAATVQEWADLRPAVLMARDSCVLVFPSTTIDWSLPAAPPDGETHWAFRKSQREEVFPSNVVSLKNARLWGPIGSVITEDNCLLEELSREVGAKGRHSIRRQFRLAEVQVTDGVATPLSVSKGDNYYHWMLDLLPRLYLLEAASIALQDIDELYVNGWDLPFQRETLETLGIPEYKLRKTHRNLHVQPRLLIASTPPAGYGAPQWVSTFLRERFGQDVQGSARRLYITRASASGRLVVNEDKVMEELSALGFETVELTTLSVRGQAELFRSAEIIIAPHGAGLTNLVFCEPGTQVIELFSPNYVNTCFWRLSIHGGLNYRYLLGLGTISAESKPFLVRDNIEVDMQQLRLLLHELGL